MMKLDQYVTGSMIKRLREGLGMTQLQLAESLNVSDKSVSKWETGRGYPDISLLGPLAAALQVSVIELMSGTDVMNTNRSFNMLRTRFHSCLPRLRQRDPQHRRSRDQLPRDRSARSGGRGTG